MQVLTTRLISPAGSFPEGTPLEMLPAALQVEAARLGCVSTGPGSAPAVVASAPAATAPAAAEEPSVADLMTGHAATVKKRIRDGQLDHAIRAADDHERAREDGPRKTVLEALSRRPVGEG